MFVECAEPCNVKWCELIHNSCGSHALVTTSQQCEFRPVWASGEHEATGSSSCRSPASLDCIMQAEVTLPGANMINISCTLIYLGLSLQDVYLVNNKAAWATLWPACTRKGGHTHSTQHLCTLAASSQTLSEGIVFPPADASATPTLACWQRVCDGDVMFSKDPVWDFALVPRLSATCKSDCCWLCFLTEVRTAAEKTTCLGNLNDKWVVNSHISVLIGAPAASPINTVSQMTVRAGNLWWFWTNPKTILKYCIDDNWLKIIKSKTSLFAFSISLCYFSAGSLFVWCVLF